MKTKDDDVFNAISPTHDIIEAARQGRMFILVDHENRENEGDLLIPAEMCTPKAVNFMATHGRGLICLALAAERIDTLGLPLMSPRNMSRHETAFTISIEAREGVSTGISAADRAQTIKVAIDPARGAKDITTPGHVFPLRARNGGVLVRAGHTEAAVDISRLAGLNPSGVICEIMNKDGSMARLPDLIPFARKHDLKIGTISDLIAYRRRHDNLVRMISESTITSEFGGEWKMQVYTDVIEKSEHIALIKGNPATSSKPTLVRMHRFNPMLDMIGTGGKGRSRIFSSAMRDIAKEGQGVVVLLNDMHSQTLKKEINPMASQTLKQYGIGAQILVSLGLHDLILLSDSPQPKIIGLDAYGLSIKDIHKINETDK